MLQKPAHFNGVQYGLNIWQGQAEDIGRSFNKESAKFSLSVIEHHELFAEFESVDVWTASGWLVTSSSVSGSFVRLAVRKGKQVGSYIMNKDHRLYHADPTKHRSEISWLYV